MGNKYCEHFDETSCFHTSREVCRYGLNVSCHLYVIYISLFGLRHHLGEFINFLLVDNSVAYDCYFFALCQTEKNPDNSW